MFGSGCTAYIFRHCHRSRSSAASRFSKNMSARWSFVWAAWSERAGPGMVYIIPGIEKMVKMDLRTVTMDIPPQDVITRDNVSVKVNAVLYFQRAGTQPGGA